MATWLNDHLLWSAFLSRTLSFLFRIRLALTVTLIPNSKAFELKMGLQCCTKMKDLCFSSQKVLILNTEVEYFISHATTLSIITPTFGPAYTSTPSVTSHYRSSNTEPNCTHRVQWFQFTGTLIKLSTIQFHTNFNQIVSLS